MARGFGSQKAQQEQLKKTARYERYGKELEDAGVEVSDQNKKRLAQWENQGGCCPCGKLIPKERLGICQRMHIIPKSLGGPTHDNNLLLGHAECNHEMGNRFFNEWVGKEGVARIQADFHLNDQQKEALKQTRETYGDYLSDFDHRQLADTRYNTVIAKEYLDSDGGNVVALRPWAVSCLRHEWGLDTLFGKVKNRDNHWHHAIDAVVMLFVTSSVVAALQWGKEVPPPWEGFREQVAALFARPDRAVCHRRETKLEGKMLEDGRRSIRKGIPPRGRKRKDGLPRNMAKMNCLTIKGALRIPGEKFAALWKNNVLEIITRFAANQPDFVVPVNSLDCTVLHRGDALRFKDGSIWVVRSFGETTKTIVLNPHDAAGEEPEKVSYAAKALASRGAEKIFVDFMGRIRTNQLERQMACSETSLMSPIGVLDSESKTVCSA